MKILWVKAGKLLPVDTGGKIRSFNILQHLAKDHEVTFLSYYGGGHDAAYEAAIAEKFPLSQTVHTSAPQGGFAQGLDYVLHLSSPAPYAVRKFSHREVRQRVTRWLSLGTFDIAVCDFLAASENFPDHPPTPVVLFQHNVESILWQRRAEVETVAWRKLPYSFEARKMIAYETRALRRFYHVIAVSEPDRNAMVDMGASCPITVVPTGVDTAKYQPVPSAPSKPPLVVFTGSMDWEPNIDAVEYFCGEIWPAVVAAFPDARFQIVGRDPHPRVQRLASTSVEVTGTVTSVTDYLRSATVVVVPLRIGGGTRLKIFEAMAMAKALISTSIGAEGLEVTHGRDLLLADDAASFTAAILQLLRDQNLRRSYEQAAALSASRHDWSQIARRFAEMLQSTLVSFRARKS